MTAPRPTLVLFDIDGTILRSEGAGVAAMLAAGRQLFGDRFTFDGVEVSGRLDCLIWRDLCARNGIEDTPSNHDRFRACYGEHLSATLGAGAPVRALPGVKELLEALAACGEMTVGLLTGNYPETGRMKVAAAGIDPHQFRVAAWGIDGPTRRHLPPVAMRRHEELLGRSVLPADVVVIGDTPHDVDCARHNGCRALAVATGAFGVEVLAQAGAHEAVATLEETQRLLGWLRQANGATPLPPSAGTTGT